MLPSWARDRWRIDFGQSGRRCGRTWHSVAIRVTIVAILLLLLCWLRESPLCLALAAVSVASAALVWNAYTCAEVDRERRLVRRSLEIFGFNVPLSGSIRMDEIMEISLRCCRVGGLVWEVTAIGYGVFPREFPIGRGTVQDMRPVAEALCCAVQRPLCEGSGESAARTAPCAFTSSQSLSTVPQPVPGQVPGPSGSRMKVVRGSDLVRVDVIEKGDWYRSARPIFLALCGVVLLVAVVVALLVILSQSPARGVMGPRLLLWGAMLFAILLGLAPSARSTMAALRGRVVVLEELECSERGLNWTRHEVNQQARVGLHLGCDTIEEVQVGANFVCLRTASECHIVGDGLCAADVRYLARVLKQAIDGNFAPVRRFDVRIAFVVGGLLLVPGWVAWEQTQIGRPWDTLGQTRWDWFWAPRHTNVIERGNQKINSDLESIAVTADGQRGWVVGSKGTILMTTGGGKWQSPPQGKLTEADLKSVTFMKDGQRGFVAGAKGTLLRTEDGGLNWQPQQTPNPQVDLAAITFLGDGMSGWAVGKETILRTRDGGRTWWPHSTAVKQDLCSVTFLGDGQRGVAVGGGGARLATSDGGTEWVQGGASNMYDYSSVAILAGGEGAWVAGATGGKGCLVELGGGEGNWKATSVVTDLGSIVRSVTFVDGRRGWAAGGDSGGSGCIWATSNGGKDWRRQQLAPAAGKLSCIAFLENGKKGWAVGRSGTIWTTSDGGNKWQLDCYADEPSDLLTISSLQDGNRVLVAGKAGLFATSDGGETWERQTMGDKPNPDVSCMTFPKGGDYGWAMINPNDGRLYSTSDSGKTWTESRYGKGIEGKFFLGFSLDGHFGWFGVHGQSDYYTTSNSGSTWTPQRPEKQLHWVTFIDKKRGWGRGDDGLYATSDGGGKWKKLNDPSADQQKLQDPSADQPSEVNFLADGTHGWGVGPIGVILATSDGGINWKRQYADGKTEFTCVTFVNEQRGWACGTEGTIVATSNGGETWTSQKAPTTSTLQCITFDGNGERGWAAGKMLTVLATSNGGKVWKNVSVRHRRDPAPWIWALFGCVCVGAFVGVVRWKLMLRREAGRMSSIVAAVVDDNPVTEEERDRLGFGPIVAALATFMRHNETRPPVTIAITAPWGRGKSSLMSLLRKRLRDEGVSTVWFNAWHHEKEPVMLAALLEAITNHALPPCLSLSGALFRLRLLWCRFRQQPYLGLGPLILALGLGGLIFILAVSLVSSIPAMVFGSQNADYVDPVVSLVLSKSREALLPKVLEALPGGWDVWCKTVLGSGFGELLALLPWIYVGVSAWFLAFRFLRPFPANPASLLASLANKFSVRQAEEQTGFRQRFRGHFAEVCQALQPYTLTIFIDDIDRCEAAKAAEMLEAANYLMSAGRCFVVIGLDKDVVEAQLGETHKNIAERLAAFAALKDTASGTEKELVADEDDAGSATKLERDRRYFARHYLRKLIQVEVPVPQFSCGKLKALQEQPRQAIDGVLKRRIQWNWALECGRYLGCALIFLLIGTTYVHVQRWNSQAKLQADTESKIVATRLRREIDVMLEDVASIGRYRAWLERKVKSDAATAAEGSVDAVGRAEDFRHLEYQWGLLKAGLTDMERHARTLDRKAFEESYNDVLRLRRAVSTLEGKDSGYKSWLSAQQASRSGAPSGRPVVPTQEASTSIIPTPPPEVSSQAAMGKDTTPVSRIWVLYPLAVLLAVVCLAWSLSSEVARDSMAFVKALKTWLPVQLSRASMRTPREAKRLLNLSRYLTLRLNPTEYVRRSRVEEWWRRLQNRWWRRRIAVDPPDTGRISEASIVGMTTMYLARPDTVREESELRLFLSLAGGVDSELAESLARMSTGNVSPFTQEEVTRFLDVVGEIQA